MDLNSIPSTENIFIYGMMLAGKTSVGKKVAEILNLDFVDLDEHVVKYLSELGYNGIGDFIEQMEGELGSADKAWEKFAEIELNCLKKILNNGKIQVISGGGRTMYSKLNRKLILDTQNLVTYYLNISLDEQVSRAGNLEDYELEHRPALKGDPRRFFQNMQDQRADIYSDVENKKDIHVDGKTVAVIAGDICFDRITKKAA